MSKQTGSEVVLTIPMHPSMELVAAQTGSLIAEANGFDQKCIEEIQLALIETCINAFEHSKSDDQRVHITFIIKDNELEFKITDRGVGFQIDPDKLSTVDEPEPRELRKRGWGLELIKNMMDSLYVDSNEHETTITLVKKKPDY
ncbi:MAG: ATP-binding protein [Candidatus Poribacteria bacterium]|nr:ATP-binding protein [Candidatus Poribacteria bacterium]MDE0505342.1 ATP-binding protein [Candidatus Poribacteria bacterium]